MNCQSCGSLMAPTMVKCPRCGMRRSEKCSDCGSSNVSANWRCPNCMSILPLCQECHKRRTSAPTPHPCKQCMITHLVTGALPDSGGQRPMPAVKGGPPTQRVSVSNTRVISRCTKCGGLLDDQGNCPKCIEKALKVAGQVAGKVVVAPFKLAWNVLNFLASLFFFLLIAGFLFNLFGGVGVAILIGAALIALVIILSKNA